MARWSEDVEHFQCALVGAQSQEIMEMKAIGSKALLAIGLLAVGVVLWFFPMVVFPAPGFNDAPILWNLPMPVIGLTLIAGLVVVLRRRLKSRPVAGSVALGIYFIGVAVAFVAGLLTFANLSNDRYWPFLLTPPVFIAAGIAVLAIALAGKAAARAELVRGVIVGGAAAVVLLVWLLARGANDWLLAPYGFDVCLLIATEAAAVFAGASWARSRQSVATT